MSRSGQNRLTVTCILERLFEIFLHSLNIPCAQRVSEFGRMMRSFMSMEMKMVSDVFRIINPHGHHGGIQTQAVPIGFSGGKQTEKKRINIYLSHIIDLLIRCFHESCFHDQEFVKTRFEKLFDDQQRCRWDFKSGWASSNVVGIICPPGCNRVN